MWTVYIIENSEERTYIGHTRDVATRLKRHNDPTGSLWTNRYAPWSLIYQESFTSKAEACQREKKLKSLKAGQKIRSILFIPSMFPCSSVVEQPAVNR